MPKRKPLPKDEAALRQNLACWDEQERLLEDTFNLILASAADNEFSPALCVLHTLRGLICQCVAKDVQRALNHDILAWLLELRKEADAIELCEQLLPDQVAQHRSQLSDLLRRLEELSDDLLREQEQSVRFAIAQHHLFVADQHALFEAWKNAFPHLAPTKTTVPLDAGAIEDWRRIGLWFDWIWSWWKWENEGLVYPPMLFGVCKSCQGVWTSATNRDEGRGSGGRTLCRRCSETSRERHTNRRSQGRRWKRIEKAGEWERRIEKIAKRKRKLLSEVREARRKRQQRSAGK